MAKLQEKFIVNQRGKRVGIILDMTEYRQLLDAYEELEAIKAYDEAKASGDEAIPLEQALEEIERAGK